MRGGLVLLGFLFLSGCASEFDPSAHTYRCQQDAHCLAGFACHPSGSLPGISRCTPVSEINTDTHADLGAIPDGPSCNDNEDCRLALLTDISPDDHAACYQFLCVIKKCAAPQAVSGLECDDDDRCTIADTCDDGVCVGESADAGVACDDDDPCTSHDACDEAGDCLGVELEEEAVCNDGDPCTLNTRCLEGECLGEPRCVSNASCVTATCVDGQCGYPHVGYCLIEGVCIPDGTKSTVDTCMGCSESGDSGGFSVIGSGGACSLNDACQTGGTCDGGECLNSEPKTDGSACELANSCVTQANCLEGTCVSLVNADEASPCDDSDPCTANDGCTSGVCVGTPMNCQAPAGQACVTPLCTENGCALKLEDNQGCFIDSFCREAEELNGVNSCLTCNPSQQTHAWSHVSSGTACGPPAAQGVCKEGLCDIKGTLLPQCAAAELLFGPGALHPKYPCHFCKVVNGDAIWAVMEPGAHCIASVPEIGAGYCVKNAAVGPNDCIWSPEVEVDAGAGWMGCDKCEADEAPKHAVTFDFPYMIDATEVQATLFRACIDAGACEHPLPLPGSKGTCSLKQIPGSDEWSVYGQFLPMNCVTHAGATQFCNWLDKDLCTEAQWERAAGGSCLSHNLGANCGPYEAPTYPWGFGQPECDLAFFASCGFSPAPLASGKGGEDGPSFAAAKHTPAVYGLAGNVSEWVADNYHKDYSGTLGDGKARTSGSGSFVHRGGSYLSASDELRSTRREARLGSEGSADLGFRCCRKP
jgi:formylglycine-generating enzyme required for sulfatase activity